MLFFVLKIRRHPTSTLFPYTTLFRSGRCRPRTTTVGGAGIAGGPQLTGRPRREIAAVDRKSTRLNSSHVSISYAVFCLKKKKIERLITSRAFYIRRVRSALSPRARLY